MMHTSGVVLINLGGPSHVSLVGDFMYRLLSDKYILPLPTPLRQVLAFIIRLRRTKKVQHHYQQIGGASPLYAYTEQQVKALQDKLGNNYMVQFAFRHSSPTIKQVLQNFHDHNITKVIAVMGYPHWSLSTTASSLDELRFHSDAMGLQLEVVEQYPQAHGYISALLEALKDETSGVEHVVISAHGIPIRLIEKGDPYVEQVQQTYAALQSKIPHARSCSLAFQSRLGPVAWTEPNLIMHIRDLYTQGMRTIGILPISFITENLETKYELDIELPEMLKDLKGLHLKRYSTPNDNAFFIEQLSQLIREHGDE